MSREAIERYIQNQNQVIDRDIRPQIAEDSASEQPAQPRLTAQEMEQVVADSLQNGLEGRNLDSSTEQTLREQDAPIADSPSHWNSSTLTRPGLDTTYMLYDLKGVTELLQARGYGEEAAQIALSIGYRALSLVQDRSDIAYQVGGDGIIAAAFSPEAVQRWSEALELIGVELRELGVSTSDYELIPGLQGVQLGVHTLRVTQAQLGDSMVIGGVRDLYGEGTVSLVIDGPLWNALELGVKRTSHSVGRDLRILTFGEIIDLTVGLSKPFTPTELDRFSPYVSPQTASLMQVYNSLASQSPSQRNSQDFQSVRTRLEPLLREAARARDQDLINRLVGQPGEDAVQTLSGLRFPPSAFAELGFETIPVTGLVGTTVIISTDNLAGNSTEIDPTRRYLDGAQVIEGVIDLVGSEGNVIADWFGEPSAFGKFSVFRLEGTEARDLADLAHDIWQYSNQTGTPLHAGLIDTPATLTVVTVPDPAGGPPEVVQVILGNTLTPFAAARFYKQNRERYEAERARVGTASPPDPWLDPESPDSVQQERDWERLERMYRRDFFQTTSEDQLLQQVDPSVEALVEAGRSYQRQQRDQRRQELIERE